ncbi:MAG TPA: hypothetical protein VGW09_05730 [Nitrososphaeraceae archaeon]|nr:hypothetical protein [Nitrososphaeraceae archaeon]
MCRVSILTHLLAPENTADYKSDEVFSLPHVKLTEEEDEEEEPMKK